MDWLSGSKLCQTKSSWASASLGLRDLRRRCPRAARDEASTLADFKLSPPWGELGPPPGGEGWRLRVGGISLKAPLLGLQRSVWCFPRIKISTWQWCPGKLQEPDHSPPSPLPGTSGSQVCDLVQPGKVRHRVDAWVKMVRATNCPASKLSSPGPRLV